MKKSVIKFSVFLMTFVIALIVIGKLMNKGHNNLTMELAPPTYPVITMLTNGVEYNELHGYKNAMDTAFQRDTVTLLSAERSTDMVVDTFGQEISGIVAEVRSADGKRLIESTPVTDYKRSGTQIFASVELKDLIEKDTEYSLAIVLQTSEEVIHYYTRVLWSDNMHLEEKLAFVTDFHERLYDREAARELTKYLETNSRQEDNKSFHKVNIHSSFKQITWGDMNVTEVTAPVVSLKELAPQTASFLNRYMVSTTENKKTVYYRVEEYFRVRYTADRMYLLDYERTMTQIPNVQQMYANDKILLGITAEDIPLLESDDGNIIVFEVADRLFSYNVISNKLAVIFSFYDVENQDSRAAYDEHSIKILDIDEGGNVAFAVYGYMNRGRHEGEVGVQIYYYDSGLNTIEELIYIPYRNTYTVLSVEMNRLLYMNRDRKLTLSLDNTVYEVDLPAKTYQRLVTLTRDDSMQVSDNHKIMVWLEGGDVYHCTGMHLKNLSTEQENVINVKAEEAVRPLGFMGEDIIYGIARKEDIVEKNSGSVFFPMYAVYICDSRGKVLKEYKQENIYITDCKVTDNQITLERLIRKEDGSYQSTSPDHIMNNTEAVVGENKVVAADIDVYERYVQIKTKSTIDAKTIKILTPKEVVFEGGRELSLALSEAESRYYVYGPYGVQDIFTSPDKAVKLAYDIGGTVVDNHGERVWRKGNRVTRNQIMAIKEAKATAEKNSLAICLETILKYEGIIRNTEDYLEQGKNALEILEENLPDMQILDLKGCSLDAVLYYVNQDIPVLAVLNNGDAVLVTGFNEFNVVIMDPITGRLYKKGMNDSSEWFAENGNSFITYTKNK